MSESNVSQLERMGRFLREPYEVVGFSIDKPTLRLAKAYAKDHQRSFASVVREALTEFIERQSRKENGKHD